MKGLALNGAAVRRGEREVFNDLDFVAPPGRLTVVLGPNGAGKTTLLRALAGLQRLARGQAMLDGVDVVAMAPRQRSRAIGYLAQAAEVRWPLPARDVVALGLTVHGARLGRISPEDAAMVEAAMAAEGVLHLADRPATALSGGEQRRVLLARALVARPVALIVDEPTAALDPGCQLDVMASLVKAARAGAAVVAATHDLALAQRFADRALLLGQGGRTLAAGPIADVLSAEGLAAAFGVRRAAGAGEALGALERINDAQG